MIKKSLIFSMYLLLLAGLFITASPSYSQVIRATGDVTEASSQLIYYFNEDLDRDDICNDVQVTNTNDTQPVYIHVQIFRSFDPDGPENPIPPTICDERDFIDLLTPNDTHVYALDEPGFSKNIGETEGTAGESTSIDLLDPVPARGFIVITPVVSESDLTAISFPHLIGSTNAITGVNDFFTGYKFNAMGRNAVDFATGEELADNAVLDGVTNGFEWIQPGELDFNYQGGLEEPCNIVAGFTFKDNYGQAGLLGYQVLPGDALWTTFKFDYKEDPTSCGNRQISCFTSAGLDDSNLHHDFNFGPVTDTLCAGTITPEQPGIASITPGVGWFRIFVNGLDDYENQVAAFLQIRVPFNDAVWLNSND